MGRAVDGQGQGVRQRAGGQRHCLRGRTLLQLRDARPELAAEVDIAALRAILALLLLMGLAEKMLGDEQDGDGLGQVGMEISADGEGLGRDR